MATIDSPLLHLHPDDNVFVAKSALALGQTISELGVRTRAQVPAGHKIAARRIAEGEQVKKYDTVIGVATRDLEARPRRRWQAARADQLAGPATPDLARFQGCVQRGAGLRQYFQQAGGSQWRDADGAAAD